MRRIALAVLALLAPSLAFAAGFEVPDNGTAALGQAGAFAAEASDPSAIYYNPAGVAGLTGVQVLIDGNLFNHSVAFQRKEGTYKVGCASGTCAETNKASLSKIGEISNSAGAFFAPLLSITYSTPLGDDGSAVGFGIGAYGPPAVGHYVYPSPNYGSYDPATNQFSDPPQRTAPQRYALIDSTVLIIYPTLTASYRYKDFLAVGGSLQYVYFNTAFDQSVTDLLPGQFNNPDHDCNPAIKGSCGPSSMRDEDPFADSLVSLKATGGAKRKVTGILGIQAKLSDRVTVGAAFRPGFAVHADGTLTLELSRLAQQVGASVAGSAASLDLNMPNQARVGVMVKLFDGFSAELDGVYEGWHATDKFTITPKDIKVTLLGVERPLDPIVVEKGFKDAYSARLGLSYKLPLPTLPVVEGVTVRAGGFYETSAIPLEFTNIDFANWERTGETVGFSIGLPHVDLQFAAAFVQQPDREVTASKVLGVGSDPGLKPFVIGNGTFKAGYSIISFGAKGHFGGTVATSPALPSPAPAPAPAIPTPTEQFTPAPTLSSSL